MRDLFVFSVRSEYDAGVMRLEHYPLEKLKKEILEIVDRHVDTRVYRVFFFGSRVSEKGTDRSDIDVGIDGPDEISPAAWAAIQEEVEEIPTLYTIDVVDFRRVAPKFREVALQAVEPLSL